LGLHQFETEQIPLGGGRSRGLGVVKLEIVEMKWIDVDGKPGELLNYLKKLVSSPEDSSIYQDGKQFKDNWTDALIQYLSDTISKDLTEQVSSGG
jgi:CRISPR/Cas system CSM-associated protein Csm3 (group 7 of RAMP superfamily)